MSMKKGSKEALEWGKRMKLARNNKIKGSGVIEEIIKGRLSYKTNVQRILSKYGNDTIQQIIIIRNPINKMWSHLSNILTFGEFERKLKKSQYDELFHLRIIVKTEKLNQLMIEKNESIYMDKYFNINQKGLEFMNIDYVPDNLTLINLMNNTYDRMGQINFFQYSAYSNNCQDFIFNILKANNLGDDTHYNFVKQDTKKIMKNNVMLRYLSNLGTNFLDRINIIIGRGNKHRLNVKIKGFQT